MSEEKAPTKPSRLALWIYKNGVPNQIKVEYRATGVDTAETWYILSVFNDGFKPKKETASIEIRPGELEHNDTYGYQDGKDVCLRLDHAHCVALTECGRKRLDDWFAYQKKEARDIAEFERLKKKFGNNI